MYSCLTLPAEISLTPDLKIPVRVLIDTRSEVNLVRRDLIPQQFLTFPMERVLLTAANQTGLGGDLQEVRCTLTMQGFEVDSKGLTPVGFQTLTSTSSFLVSGWL